MILIFLSLKIVLILANNADPDEMQHYAAFHLGLHCLPKYMGFPVYKRLIGAYPIKRNSMIFLTGSNKNIHTHSYILKITVTND